MLLQYHLILVASIFLSTCSSLAIPIERQAPFQLTTHDTPDSITTKISQPLIEKVPSTAYIEHYELIDTLDEHYSAIVKQVVDSTIKEIKETALETFLTIHDLQLIGRDYCRTSVDTFTQVLEQELDRQVKSTLLVSVRSLLDIFDAESQSIIDFNTLMSEQLSLLLNPQQVSNNIIKQLYPSENENIFIKYLKPLFDKKWAQANHHEKNEFFALEAWLRSWLIDIEFLLKDEFDSRIPTLL